ncbi:MAG: hypothetical protein Q4D96_02600 [Propionibacteriaceae bacterium]|nr:hypothetical protein [Propionibacteriaceae bacterium]
MSELINPDLFPCRAEGLDPETIFASGASIVAVGVLMGHKLNGVDTVWQQLRWCYRSPEQEMVYGLMQRAGAPASRIIEDLAAAGSAIQQFAEELREIKPKLEKVESQAREFRAEALQGYPEEVGNWLWIGPPPPPEELAQMSLDEGPRRTENTDWRRHQHAVNRNNSLLADYNFLFEQVVRAVEDCERVIRRLYSKRLNLASEPAPTFPHDFQHYGEYPWGSWVERRSKNFPDAFGMAFSQFSEELAFDAMAHVGMDEEFNFSLENAWQTWQEDFAFIGLTAKAGFQSAGHVVVGRPVTGKAKEELDTVLAGWGDVILWDHQAALAGKNGWHAYEEDPQKAYSRLGLNLLVPSFGARGVLRAAKGARVLPRWVHRGLEHTDKALRFLERPVRDFRQRVTNYAVTHVIDPVDARLRDLGRQVLGELRGLHDAQWRNTALAGAHHGRGHGAGMWHEHTSFNQVHDGHGRGSGHGQGSGHGFDDPAPRRAAPGQHHDALGHDPSSPEARVIENPEVEAPPRRTDRYGNELIVDDRGDPLPQERHDGRMHYASDPEGTFRDRQGVLHSWLDGQFVEDPYKIPGHIDERASWGQHPHEYGWPDSSRQGLHDATNHHWGTLREDARTARAAAKGSVEFADRLVPEADSKSYQGLAKALDRQLKKSDLTDAQRAEIKHHQKLLDDAHKAEKALRKGSEWAGDRSGHLMLEDQGHQVILGETGPSPADHSSPGAGAFDQAGISGPDIESPTGKRAADEHYTLTFQENKGGDSPQLNTRNSAQQGTLSYLRDLLTNNTDPRLKDNLIALRDAGHHPGFFRALERGEVVVRYQYANARTNGTLRTGEFNLGHEVRIRWSGGDFELITKEPA